MSNKTNEFYQQALKAVLASKPANNKQLLKRYAAAIKALCLS